MKIFDISRGIFSAPLYPGTESPVLRRLKDIGRGDEYNLSSLAFDLHTASHADAESHFLPDGRTIDLMPLQGYVGLCRVADMGLRVAADLPNARERKILLLKNSRPLSTGECREIIAKGYETLGCDSLSLAAPDDEKLIHTLLFSSGIAVIESLDLTDIEEGGYFLVAAPVKIEGAEAAPLRAVLIKFD